jgi:hypothetical protein
LVLPGKVAGLIVKKRHNRAPVPGELVGVMGNRSIDQEPLSYRVQDVVLTDDPERTASELPEQHDHRRANVVLVHMDGGY